MRRAYSRSRIGLGYLVAALALLAGGYLLAQALSAPTRTPYYATQYAAAERMRAATQAVRDYADAQGIDILPDDLNATGLIGPEFTEITTTSGALEAKRSAINPNFAALLVRYYVEAGLVEGDTIAVGTSGSFPGLTLAAVAAANEMGLNVRLIASFGSSTNGATRLELPITTILEVARERGILAYTLLATSPGGSGDQLRESFLFGDVAPTVRQLAERAGVEFIDEPHLADSIARRLALYGPDIKLFVNVGGASANSGESSYTLSFPGGLLLDPPPIPDTPTRGLTYEYAALGVPVVNLLNVRGLCVEHGLPYDPSPLPPPGEGGCYATMAYPKLVVYLALALAAITLALGKKKPHA